MIILAGFYKDSMKGPNYRGTYGLHIQNSVFRYIQAGIRLCMHLTLGFLDTQLAYSKQYLYLEDIII